MSNKDVTTTSSEGIGFCGLLFIVFLILKLCGVIPWSWWWVTAPLWIPVALFLCVCLIVFIVGICIGVVRYLIKDKRGS